MIIKSIKIDYYKSLGEEHNVLKLDDAVTVIIGKNESDKSNILSALSGLTISSKGLPQFESNITNSILFGWNYRVF